MYDPAEDTADTIAHLNNKTREAATLGRPVDAVDYANALQAASAAYDYLAHPTQTDDQ